MFHVPVWSGSGADHAELVGLSLVQAMGADSAILACPHIDCNKYCFMTVGQAPLPVPSPCPEHRFD